MWLKLSVCFLVAFASANHNPGWDHETEYVYKVRGRSLTSLDQNTNEYSGIFLEANLAVRPRRDGHLGAEISGLQYANFHADLKEGWRQPVPDGELSYQEIPVGSGNVKIEMKNGLISDIYVDRSIPNWLANMYKGILSPLQLDTRAENKIHSSYTLIPQEGNNAVYKTMEKTVTGETETLYEIHPFPEHVLQSEPWLAPHKELKGDGEFMEVVTSKNYTHSIETPAYHFGLQGVDDFDINNKIGEFFSRTSWTRAVLSGKLDDYTIQSSMTVDQVTMQPTLEDKQRGSTNSIVNLTLISVGSQKREFDDVSNAINVGLLYRYNIPFDESNGARARGRGGELSSYISSSETGSDNLEEDYPSVNEQPHIYQAPGSPLLPFTVGYDGQVISLKQNIEEKVRTLAKTIGQEFNNPENIPERNTVGKFVILSTMMRVMNQQQMKTVANKLYTNTKHGIDAYSWTAYRDAVAQAGTGPALLNIKEWIQDGKISGEEAAQVVATAASSARQPTEKYMEVFFEMIQNQEFMKQKHLNDSLVLSFTNLVHEVYVSKGESSGKYPVHSFGSFNTARGHSFIKSSVIPHLQEKLEEAVSDADTRRIHLYIRALGNVGHHQILQVFKPYLEGTKKMSQLQRVLMVTAFDNLVRSNPRAARSVLYKIYQNTRDFEQVRIAAVYQLMRTDPPASMLQRMARYTNIDTNNHVNSAVKSTIEAATELKQAKFYQLRLAAQSAKPLLTAQEFGAQNPKVSMRSFVDEQMEMEAKEILETFSGEDSILPRGIHYLLRGRYGGVKQQALKMEWMVSSVEDLINVFEQQTKSYRGLLKEKQSVRSVNTKWSSEWAAKRLNMQNEQREQLESYLLLQLDALSKVWSFDNQTFENLTEIVKEIEDELRSGKHFDYNKMTIHPESALSLPTAWGLPFIYTYDRPVLLHIEGDLKVVADPAVSSSEGLLIPNSVDIDYSLEGFASGRIQSQFGFFAPFNHKRYTAGYDRNIQVRVPQVSGKVILDIRNKQVSFDAVNTEKKNVKLLHFSTWPYTAQYSIDEVKPQTRIIKKEMPQQINTVFGEKLTGIAFTLEATSDEPVDVGVISQKLRKQEFASLLGSWLDDNIQHTKIDFGYDSGKSKTQKMFVHFGHQQKFNRGSRPSPEISESISRRFPISLESWKRQKEFLKNSAEGITSARSQVMDAVVLFEGQRTIKYSATLAGARSNIDPKGRLLMQAEKDNQQEEPVKFYLKGDSHMPNTNSLDLGYALNFNPTTSFSAVGGVEKRSGDAPEISVDVKLSKSEERKQYLKEQPEYQKCQKEMRQGNNQLPSCAALTAQANLLDKFYINIDYKNFSPVVVNSTYKLYSFLREYFYPRVSENILVPQGSKMDSYLQIEGKFSPDLSTLNASISTNYGRAEIKDVDLDLFARSVIVLHPVYRVKQRFGGHALNYDTYQPICVVDKDFANTLDNKTYPINLDKDWVVLLHYVPRRPSPIKGQPELPVTEQLNQDIEGYIIYGRASGNDNSHKDIKMVIQSPYTRSRVIDVTLKPSSDPNTSPRLFIENEEIMYSDAGTHLYDDYMQVYKLPNNEIKAEVYDIFDVVYDGVRAKISVVNDKFRDAARGLCGTFTGEEETDFTHPGNCILHSPEVFVAANTVTEKERNKRMNDMLMIRDEDKKCYQKTIGYVGVVSVKDSGIGSLFHSGRSNMLKKAKYVKIGEETCFSLYPLDACPPGRRENESTQSVSVHCVKSSRVADMWIEKIERGVNPNFEHKSESRRVSMKVAQSCD